MHLWWRFFNQEDQSLDIHTSASSSVPLDIPMTPSVQSPVHANSHDSDGKAGIGLSLLQNLESRESDDGSTGRYTGACQREGQNNGSTVEGLLYHNIIDDSNVPNKIPPRTSSLSSSSTQVHFASKKTSCRYLSLFLLS